ncbi:MAG: hypothetical protein FRX49_10362 [Trebouxia sp. A1-2]|nr:MAG: hypothetical protein FRX49_10362 [Trebouxia sp. A1-2]
MVQDEVQGQRRVDLNGGQQLTQTLARKGKPDFSCRSTVHRTKNKTALPVALGRGTACAL